MCYMMGLDYVFNIVNGKSDLTLTMVKEWEMWLDKD